MKCKMCRERVKDWNGSDPVCAFDGEFAGNWNCATVNAIRDICYEGQPDVPGVVYQYCDDQKYATINISDIETPDGSGLGFALWVLWYKSRGGTDAMWLLDKYEPPRIPTEEECLLIIEHYKPLLPAPVPFDPVEFERVCAEIDAEAALYYSEIDTDGVKVEVIGDLRTPPF